ncbi:MAG TPA: hypothetical protein VN948_24060 [Terriglobales bacterium]|nr:hypothetical protein [Terriglobales bacterium]
MTDRLAHISPLQRVFLRRARSDIPTPFEHLAYWTKRRREEVESDRQREAVDKERAIREEMRKQEIAREAARRLPATPAAADNLATKRQPGSTLEHSDDYRIISFKGQRLHLTQRQATIMRVLHQSPYCEASTKIIKKQTKCGALSDSFKTGDGPEIWKKLIVPLDHPRGFYRLNLTPKN